MHRTWTFCFAAALAAPGLSACGGEPAKTEPSGGAGQGGQAEVGPGPGGAGQGGAGASGGGEPGEPPAPPEPPLPPTGEDAERAREILLRSLKYQLKVWWPEKGYAAQTGPLLDFGGSNESRIRPACAVALALAVALRTGAYDEAIVGVPVEEAREVALRLVVSLAARHEASSADGGAWGDGWQTALWASFAGLAGWLVWDDIPAEARGQVSKMIVREADRFVGAPVPVLRRRDGSLVTPGDSKAEENAWNARVVTLALAMFPGHASKRGWRLAALRWLASAYARHSDVKSTTELHGRPVCQWLDGSNLEEDFTVVNHKRIHPDYMNYVHNASAALHMQLAGKAVPRAAFFNLDRIFAAYVDLPFSSPPYAAPGGTIYVKNSPDIYYPEGSDWGTRRREIYLLIDAQAHAYGLDALASVKAPAWESLHAGEILAMMDRFEDGRTFGPIEEFKSEEREQSVAERAAHTYLTKWLEHAAGKVEVEDEAAGDLLPPPDASCAPVVNVSFCPGDALTRAHMAPLLLRTMKGASYEPPPASGVFSDVPKSHPQAAYIEALAAEGITQGCKAGAFCPNDAVTRAQAATFVYRAKHGASSAPPPAKGIFSDLPAESPHAPYVESLAAEGIVKGCTPSTFCPNEAITRAQTATVLVRAKHGATYAPPSPAGAFIDVPVAHAHAPSVEQLYRDGITRGCGK